MSILLISACADEIIWSYLTDFHQEKPVRVLPSSFTECPDTFFWSTGKFISSAPISKDIEVSTDTGSQPNKSGLSASNIFSTLDASTEKLCTDIQHAIIGHGPYVEHRIFQSFDYSEVTTLIRSTNTFREINTGNAYILNSSYSMDSYMFKIYDGSIGFPIAVQCDNNWLVKNDLSTGNSVLFEQPQGKCHFSLDDHELELPTGEKVGISFRGSYEIDSEYPDKIMLVKIEKIGFKKLS